MNSKVMQDKDKVWMEFKIKINGYEDIDNFHKIVDSLYSGLDESVRIIAIPITIGESSCRLIYSPYGHDKRQLKKAQKYLDYILKKQKENE